MMAAADNRATAQLAYAARLRGDLDGFLSMFDAGAVMHQAWSLPYGGVYRGVADVRRGLSRMMEAWDHLAMSIERMTGGGDLVIPYLHVHVVRERTGISCGYPAVEVCRFREGRVIEFTPFNFDTCRLNQVYGR